MVLWEPAAVGERARLRVRPPARDDRAVSPVVGMVLVLGISIVGIAAIMYWGLPAIDEMKANVEHQSVEAQFQELDASIKELVAGTTEKTAKRWQPTLNRGSVLLVNETEAWVYAVELQDDAKQHDFLYRGFADTDNMFWVSIPAGSTALSNAEMTAFRVTGSTSGQDLKVYYDNGGVETLWSSKIAWAANSEKKITLKDSDGKVVPIKDATIRFRIFENGAKVAEAFFVPTGRVDYRLDAGLGTKTVTQNNGAVLSGNGYTSAIVNPPPIPPLSTSGEVPRFFARTVLLNATGSFGGNDRFDVLVSLYATSTLASYDCVDTTTPKSDCVESVKLFLFGEHKTTWHAYLTNKGRGYTFEEAAGSGDYGSYLWDDVDTGAGFTLLQSTVQMAAG